MGPVEVTLIDEADGPTHVLRVQAEGRARTPINLFLGELAASLHRDYSSFYVREKLDLAIEVFMAAATERTPRARFLDYVTVLEILSEEQPRPRESIEIIDKAMMEHKNRRADLGGEEAQSLRSSLERLRQSSIGKSVKELSRGLDAEAIAGYDEGDIGRFFGGALRNPDGDPRDLGDRAVDALHRLTHHAAVALRMTGDAR